MKKLYAIASVALCFTLLTGCGKKETPPTVDNTSTPNVATANKPEANTGTQAEVNSSEFTVTTAKALETFSEKFPNAQLTKIGIDFFKNQYHYEVEGIDGEMECEMEIDAYTGKILRDKTVPIEKDDLFEEQNQVFNLTDAVSEDVAINAAIEKHPGTLHEWTLDKDDGMLKYEVTLIDNNRDFDVIVNATTGEVVGIDD